jgi:multicomponent Na+:H+ antiporter subunit F
MDELSVTELISYSGLLIAFLLVVVRLARGPSLNDRIMALDLIANITSGFILVYVFITGLVIYLDVVLIISLISFLGSVGISLYLKKKHYGA